MSSGIEKKRQVYDDDVAEVFEVEVATWWDELNKCIGWLERFELTNVGHIGVAMDHHRHAVARLRQLLIRMEKREAVP